MTIIFWVLSAIYGTVIITACALYLTRTLIPEQRAAKIKLSNSFVEVDGSIVKHKNKKHALA